MIQTLALAAVAAALVLPLPAHASIVGTNPEDGSSITALPEAFAVTANEEIVAIDGGSSNVILITDQAGAYYGDGCTDVDGATLSTVATLGEAGVYTMRYGLVSADGHPIEGVVTFAWEPDATAAAVPGQAEAPVCGVAAPTESASPEPSASAGSSAEPTSEASQPPSSTTAPSASPSSDASAEDDGGLPTLAYLGIGLALLAAVVTVLVVTWRRGLKRELGDGTEPKDPDLR